jgi:hypothetical protein
MRLAVQLRQSDFLEANRAAPRSRLYSWVLIVFGCAMILAGLFVRRLDGSNMYLVAAWGLVFLAMGVASPYVMAWGAYRTAPHDLVLDLSDDGVELTLPDESTTLSWARFTRAYETQGLLVLAQGPLSQLAILIPKRHIPAMELDSLRAMLATRVGSIRRLR